jgi:hypothetical protein
VACSSRSEEDAGFATASALVVCASLAIIAGGVASLSVAELRRSRSELERVRIAYALDAAQVLAAADLMKSSGPGRLEWSVKTGGGSVDVLAEPESAKASLPAAAALDEAVFTHLGVTDAALLKQRLQHAADEPSQLPAIADLDAAALWRSCAPSAVSAFGRRDKLELAPAGAPQPGGFSWRPGEIWRVRATAQDGWTEDRIVRFTGDVNRPTATIAEQLLRQKGEDAQCNAALAPST